MFQSLIGIIEDFDTSRSERSASKAMFQSLIGIIEDFDKLVRVPIGHFVLVSIPDRDYRGFRHNGCPTVRF